MSKYNITVSIKKEDHHKFPKDTELKDILGEPLGEYYDGWGSGTDYRHGILLMFQKKF